jgi:hypothetical protein
MEKQIITVSRAIFLMAVTVTTEDFVVADDAGFAAQLTKFASEEDTLTGLGFTTDQITAAGKDAKYMTFCVKLQTDTQSYAQGNTKYKNLARHGNGTEVLGASPVFPTEAPPELVVADIEARFRGNAAQAKSSGDYTTAKGEILNIVAVSKPFDPSLGKPTFKIFMDSGHPVLKFVKGAFDGVEIWVDRGDGKGYVKLERALSTPFVDPTALPAAGTSAVWKYKMIYVMGNKIVGFFSDEATITVYGNV